MMNVEQIYTGCLAEAAYYIESEGEVAIFTGNTLFIGDIGRPDLTQHVIVCLTEEKLASYLYNSLRNKIMPLSDDLIVYPNHGAGSTCGKNMNKETTNTLGNQKKVNYALNPELMKEQFIKEILTSLTPPPAYFPKNVLMNINGYESLDTVLNRNTQALSPQAFEAVANEIDVLILDVRDASVFAKGYIPKAINIGLEGQFATWVGTLIPDLKHPILLITEKDKQEEAIIRLARVGYDNCIGFLEGGFEAWEKTGKPIDQVQSFSAEAFRVLFKENPTLPYFDVRRKNEYLSEHVVGIENLPLETLCANMAQLKKDELNYLHCAGGYRSMIAISILKARGFDNVVDISGGFSAIKKVGKVPLTDYVCLTSLFVNK